MAVICGREKWTILLTLTSRPPTPPPELLAVMAVMTEKTKGRQKRNSGNRGEILEWGRQKKYLRCAMLESEDWWKKAKTKNKYGRSSGAFIKTIIVQNSRIPPGARAHVEAHIIN